MKLDREQVCSPPAATQVTVKDRVPTLVLKVWTTSFAFSRLEKFGKNYFLACWHGN